MSKYKTQTQTNYENFETLKELLGESELLAEIIRAMSGDECRENLEFIARMHDVKIITKDDDNE